MSIEFSLLQNLSGYIDPGSGSIITQAIIGALVGVGITLKVYWTRLKMFFVSKNSKS